MAADAEIENILPFHIGLFELLGACARCDGGINAQELQQLERIAGQLKLSSAEKSAALNASHAFDGSGAVLKSRIFYFYWAHRLDKAKITRAMDALIGLATCDGPLNCNEEYFFQAVLLGFGLDNHAFKKLLKSHTKQHETESRAKQEGPKQEAPRARANFSLAEALEILGCASSASISEVKRAYRKAVKHCHPDRMHTRDESELQKGLTRKRFLEVQAAYEIAVSQLR